MATKVLTDPQHYTNIANAIREKNGTSDTYTPADMSSAILAIETGGSSSSGSIFSSTASGRIPEVERGTAASVLTLDGVFISIVSGTVS